MSRASYIKQMIKIYDIADSKILIQNAINKRRVDVEIPVSTGKWFHFVISQVKEQTGYVYNITVDDVVVKTVVENKPPGWENDVKVYASNPWNEAADGFIRNAILYGKNGE